MYEVDLRPLAEVAIEILGALALALGTFAIARLNAWLGLRQDSEVRAYLELALQRGVTAGLGRIRAMGADPLKVETKDALVAAVAAHLTTHVPDALKRFGLTDEKKLARLIEARILGLDVTAAPKEREQ